MMSGSGASVHMKGFFTCMVGVVIMPEVLFYCCAEANVTVPSIKLNAVNIFFIGLLYIIYIIQIGVLSIQFV